MRFEVEVDRVLKTVRDLPKKVTKVNLPKSLAELYAKNLRSSIMLRSDNPSGQLAESIKVRKVGRYGSGVYAAHYFWYANDGRAPGRAPFSEESAQRFVSWALATGWNPETLADNIAEYGTQPKFFFEAALELTAAERPRAFKKIMKGINR